MRIRATTPPQKSKATQPQDTSPAGFQQTDGTNRIGALLDTFAKHPTATLVGASLLGATVGNLLIAPPAAALQFSPTQIFDRSKVLPNYPFNDTFKVVVPKDKAHPQQPRFVVKVSIPSNNASKFILFLKKRGFLFSRTNKSLNNWAFKLGFEKILNEPQIQAQLRTPKGRSIIAKKLNKSLDLDVSFQPTQNPFSVQ